MTILIELCKQKNPNIEEIKSLIDSGVNVDKKDEDWTPLHRASKKGHLEIVKLLLDRGANVDKKNMYGRSLLYIESKFGHLVVNYRKRKLENYNLKKRII